MDAEHAERIDGLKAGRPLRLTMNPDLPASIRGQECVIVAVADLGAFGEGQRGVLVRFKDRAIRYQGGRPEGSFYLHHFAEPAVAIAHAAIVGAQPIRLIRREGGEFLTNRGTFQVQAVQYADGGKAPRLREEDWRLICEQVAGLFSGGIDSEGNPV